MESKKPVAEKELNPNHTEELSDKLDKVDGGMTGIDKVCQCCGCVCGSYQKYCHACGAKLNS